MNAPLNTRRPVEGYRFEIEQALRRARRLRNEVLTRAACAPWRWLRTRVEEVRAPIDFEPV